MVDSTPSSILVSVQSAYDAHLELEKAKSLERSQGILAMAQGLRNAFNEILEANTLDLEISREMAVPDLIVDWLKLTPERLQTTVEILEALAELGDPIEQVMSAPYQLNLAQTYSQRMPLGVIALIYEAFPELSAIAAGLCLKTGNSLILRGCGSASNSNAAIAQVLQEAIDEVRLPVGCLQALSSERGTSIQDLVVQDQYINLVIPYGRPSLIKQVTQSATVPVLRVAMGNCYLYWSDSGNVDLVRSIILDSHASIPDPVNAIEKVLISANLNPSSRLRLFNSLQEQGFQLRGEGRLAAEYPEYIALAKDSEWGTSYLNKVVAFKVVANLPEALTWINQYSSGHADCLVTESYQESRQFATKIDSALVYINSSPRFSRHPDGGDSVFLGISNQKGNRRGLIGLKTFTTLKQVIQGGDY